MNLDSKTAIVTGAGSGLGAAISEALISENVVVYGLARSGSALEKMNSRLGNRFKPVVLDITDRNGIKNWFSETFSDSFLPDILINNAGAGAFARIDEMEADVWDGMIQTNLTGMYNITAEAVRLMRTTNEFSHIINIGSILGSVTRAEGAAYSATKFGVSGFSDSLFKELRGDNIKVTCVNPGSIDTHFFETSGIESHTNMLQPGDIATTIIHVLKTPDNMLINELTIRPLNPKKPKANT